MPYTFTMSALWIALGALLGFLIGWLRHPLFCRRHAGQASGVPQEDYDRLRHRVANLEPVVAERDQLKARLEGLEGELKTAKASLVAAPVVAAGVDQDVHDGVVRDRDRLIAMLKEHEQTAADRERLASLVKGHETSIETHRATIAGHESTIETHRATIAGHEVTIADHEATIASLRSDLAARPLVMGLGAADLDRAKEVYGKTIKLDDLKIVEGIGPVLEGVFNAAGITTWAALADATPDQLRSIMTSADERHRIHNPTTWPRQARLANLGEFEALKVWQDSLSAGKE